MAKRAVSRSGAAAQSGMRRNDLRPVSAAKLVDARDRQWRTAHSAWRMAANGPVLPKRDFGPRSVRHRIVDVRRRDAELTRWVGMTRPRAAASKHRTCDVSFPAVGSSGWPSQPDPEATSAALNSTPRSCRSDLGTPVGCPPHPRMAHIGRRPPRAPTCTRVHDECRRSEQTTLYRLVRQNAANVFAHAETSSGAEPPCFTKDDFDPFHGCAILRCSVLSLRDGQCGHAKLCPMLCRPSSGHPRDGAAASCRRSAGQSRPQPAVV